MANWWPWWKRNDSSTTNIPPRIAPKWSIKYCLDTAGCSLDDVDLIAVGWDGEVRNSKFWFASKRYHRYQQLMTGMPFHRGDGRIRYVNHHLSHALSSYYASGFSNANVISLDASGGQEFGLLGYGEGDDFEVLERFSKGRSWGRFYGTFTQILGFTPHSDEGKVMGLAAYGTPDPDLFKFIDWDAKLPTVRKDLLNKQLSDFQCRNPGDELTDYHKNLAATVQYNLEQAVIRMSEYLHQKTGSSAVCMGGGCALNCSANGKVLQQPHVQDIFIQPAAHDASTALGAAMKVYRDEFGSAPDCKMEHAYWGPEFSDEEILTAIKMAKISRYRKADNLALEVAQLIYDNKVVGWFQGRMEIGPRALGGRSILGNPKNPEMKDIINKYVKNREPWRPFAPSMLEEAFGPYVEDPYDSPFMILAFKATDEKVQDIISASHVDKTVRVQTVKKHTNKPYWELISAFHELSGVPAVLNTSFNVAGQPIVHTPFDAIGTFYGCGLDYLAIGNYIIEK